MLPISIGDVEFENSLIDLGANVNVIPLLVVRKFGDLRIEQTMRTLQMVDKTCRKLVGTIKDVLI